MKPKISLAKHKQVSSEPLTTMGLGMTDPHSLLPVFLQCHSSSTSCYSYSTVSFPWTASAQTSKTRQKKIKNKVDTLLALLTWVSSTIDRHGYSHQNMHNLFVCTSVLRTKLLARLLCFIYQSVFCRRKHGHGPHFRSPNNFKYGAGTILHFVCFLQTDIRKESKAIRNVVFVKKKKNKKQNIVANQDDLLSRSTLPSSHALPPTIENLTNSYLF